jgi:hypothetical protein
MEFVQMLQRVSEAVEKLEETFIDDGSLNKIWSKLYVQTTHKGGNKLHITKEYKKGWDDRWKAQDKVFVKGCESIAAFAGLKDLLFPVFDGNH